MVRTDSKMIESFGKTPSDKI